MTEEHATTQPPAGGSALPRTVNDTTEETRKPPADEEAERSAKRPSRTKLHKAIMRSLGDVREAQATLYDPKRRRFDCCRGFDWDMGEPAVFDHEEESTARFSRPLDEIPESRLDCLMIALNVIHMKVLASDVGFPISVFGNILMRDDLDFKCIYLFQRDRDNCQVISSPDEMLNLIGPNRGPAEADVFYFEINLKIRGEEPTMDMIFSRTLVYQEYPLDAWTKKQQVSSWLSTLEFSYRSVHYAVEATVGIKILRGTRFLHGSLIASTSKEPSEMVLYDSERWGANTKVAEDGSVNLPRCLVILRVDEDLFLKVCVFGRRHRRAKPKTTVLTVEHSDRSFDIKLGCYHLQVTVSWSGILLR
ncbi:hypothetical protein VPH35_115968 [Triticum aestivum]|uniref:uncharacterized protein n=1 Tax=Triticum aestivum TaxID=4565 RepID=UPI001D010A1A|nr:uncharacterized protein LOC123141202 [Triticum aestivum]